MAQVVSGIGGLIPAFHEDTFRTHLRNQGLPGQWKFGLDLFPYQLKKYQAVTADMRPLDGISVALEELAAKIAGDVREEGAFALLDVVNVVVIPYEGKARVGAKLFAIVPKAREEV